LFWWAVFAACLTPGLILAIRFYRVLTGVEPDALGSDPVVEVEHQLGRLALQLLLLTLTVTPLRRLTGLNGLQKIRRLLGLWAFTYATLHFSTYLIFDQLCYSPSTCDFTNIWHDLVKRKFTFVGMFAFSLLLLLALTSTNGWIRRLGKRWQRLHRIVYVAAVAGIVHFAWGQKSDISEPLKWGAYLALLFGVRVYLSIQKRRDRARLAVAAAPRSTVNPSN